MEMRGTAMGNVTMDIGDNMRILPGARIGGNLEYTAPRPAEIAEDVVSGEIIHREPPDERRDVFGIIGGIIGYLWLLLVGILFLVIAPVVSQRITDNISANPLKNLLWGILFLIVTPILAVILLITIIGIPLGLILMVIYIISLYISRIFVGLWVGQYIFKASEKKTSYRILSFAIGLLIVFIGINLPILGIFIHFIVIVLGLGAIVLTAYGYYKSYKEQKSI